MKPEDSKIGKLQEDKNGSFRMVDGKKIIQIKEETQDDIDTNLAINRYRASGRSPWFHLNN